MILNGVAVLSFSPILVTPSTIPPLSLNFGAFLATSFNFEGSIKDLNIAKGGYITFKKNKNDECVVKSGISSPFCLLCNSLFYLNNGTCVMTCPDGTYSEMETKTCRRCDASCDQCKGPTSGDCTRCSKSLPFRFKTYCFGGGCPYGSKVLKGDQNDLNFVCGCDDSCATCDYDEANSIAKCLTCTNKEFAIANDQARCVKTTECNVNSFADFSTSDGICKSQCPLSLRIYNSIDRKCVDYCRTGSLVLNSLCLNQCPDNYYNRTSKNFKIYC